MHIEIVSPDEKIFSGEIHLVQLPGVVGSFEIMDSHTPIISALKAGKMKIISKEGEVTYFDIDGGVVEVSHNIVTVLTNQL